MVKLCLGWWAITALVWTTDHPTVRAQEEQEQHPHQEVRHRELASYEARPVKRYTPYSQLDASSLAAAAALQYTAQMWDNPFTAPIETLRVFNNLTVAEKLAAAAIDCGTLECWDCYQNHYAEYFWSELPVSAQEGYGGLGWTPEAFDGNMPPPSEQKDWRFLSAAEQQAADKICYWDKLWDEIPLSQWNATCFSGETLVQVLRQQKLQKHQDQNQTTAWIRMEDLQIGDSVQTAEGTFSKVYSFGHKDLTKPTKYLQIFSASMDKDHPLEISPEHLIYTHDASKKAWKLVPAGDLSEGDSLLSTNGRPSTILWIREVQRKGAYAPLTMSGNLLVNGVLASSYVSRNWLKDHVSGLALHKFQHGAMLPVRFFCSLVGCKAESYNESTGYSAWVQFWYEIEQWMLTLPLAWRATFLSLLLVPAAFMALLGNVSLQPMSSLGTHAVAVLIGYFIWKRQNPKKSVPGNESAEIGGKGVAT